MKQSTINRLKLKNKKVNINSIEMFKECLEYNIQYEPKVKMELVKWPIYLQYWQYLEKTNAIIPFTIKTTTDNLTLSGDFIRSPTINDNNKTTMILLHGITNTRFWIFKQASIFLRAGYNIVWYDARNHGASDAAPTTFGLKEAQDLQDIINYSCTNYPDNTVNLGLYGFSLGGATATIWTKLYHQYEINKKVKLIIADCTFSRLDRTYYEKLNNYAFLPTNLMLNWIHKKAQKTFGIAGLQELQPIKYLKLVPELPMLFLHGQADKFINYTNSQDLYEEKKRYENTKKSTIYTILGANHGQTFLIGDFEQTVVNAHNLVIDQTISNLTLAFIEQWTNS